MRSTELLEPRGLDCCLVVHMLASGYVYAKALEESCFLLSLRLSFWRWRWGLCLPLGIFFPLPFQLLGIFKWFDSLDHFRVTSWQPSSMRSPLYTGISNRNIWRKCDRLEIQEHPCRSQCHPFVSRSFFNPISCLCILKTWHLPSRWSSEHMPRHRRHSISE